MTQQERTAGPIGTSGDTLTQAYCILRLKYTKVRGGPALSYILASTLNKVTQAAYFPTFFRNTERCLAANTSIALLISIYIFFWTFNPIVNKTSKCRREYEISYDTYFRLLHRESKCVLNDIYIYFFIRNNRMASTV